MIETKKIEQWTKMYTESLPKNSYPTEKDIINNIFSTMLYFLNGEGNKVLKDGDWMNYLINDMHVAIEYDLFDAKPEDKKRFDQILDK